MNFLVGSSLRRVPLRFIFIQHVHLLVLQCDKKNIDTKTQTECDAHRIENCHKNYDDDDYYYAHANAAAYSRIFDLKL